MTPESTSPESEQDWAGRATATVVGYVDQVRSATTGKALVASRYAVYATAMVLIALVVGVLLLIMLVRLLASLTALLPFINDGEIWLTYLLIGTMFLLGGLVAWHKKEAVG
jgi:hypothetical protein